LAESARDALAERLVAYMQKALREAKRHTSWVSPNAAYEDAVTSLIHALLTDDRAAAFRADLNHVASRIARAGAINGLAQLLLKATLPGAPDFYQGTEFWDFNLVDPDNRRPVDFESRAQALAHLQGAQDHDLQALLGELGAHLGGDHSKLYVTYRALAVRTRLADLFTHGEYRPLPTSGAHADRLIAYERRQGEQRVAVVVPRHVQCLLRDDGSLAWDDSRVELPSEAPKWRHELTGQIFEIGADGALASELLAPLPIAILTSQP
ncbi:MAG TPA: hypothetical protein VEQ85_12855, partial [Lacipirellulaceae bacterium]|nr:hypothetical protein [Lacipirellulaceae bacterium]